MNRVLDLTTTPIKDGITVVEASAGTGKTYCLTGLVLRLLLEERVSEVGKVLVVTFTNAATHELVTRLRAALRRAHRLLCGEETTDDAFFRHLVDRHGDDRGRAVLRRAALSIDDLGVFTIHGFCKRVLQESAFESGIDFQPEFIDNDEPLLLGAARDFWRRRLYPAGDLVAAAVVEEGWTPESFVGDYRVWRRHPDTLVLPAAKALPEAIDELHATVAELERVWQGSAMRTFLASLAYLKKAAFDADRSGALVDGVEAFLGGRFAAGLYAVKLLAADRLAAAVRKAHRPAAESHPACRACGDVDSAVRELEHSLRKAFITEVDEIFDRAKRATGTLAFDDLLRQLHGALRDPVRGPVLQAVVRGRYQAVLVDEFQDTDLIQYEIFHGLFRRGPLFLIGDPKQAIYRFRGADVFAYVEAKADADRLYTLDCNWRSDDRLLAAVNALFTSAPRAFVFEQIPFERSVAAEIDARQTLAGDGRPPLQWIWLPKQANKELAGRCIRRSVAAEIVRLLAGGLRLHQPGKDGKPGEVRDLEPSDVAILVRTNAQAEELQRALRQVRVPAVVSRAGDIFDSDEMEELQRLLAAVADPTSTGRARAAWATRVWGDDAAALRGLEDDDEAWQERLEELDELRRAWLGQGFMAMIQRLIRGRGVRRRWLAGEAGERRLTNLLHAVEVLHQAILERHLSPAGLVAWLEAERSAQRVHDSDATELRLESDARAVQIATVHKSKGLEYGIVFCPYLWEAVPQDRPPVTAHVSPRQVVYDFGSDEFAGHRAKAEAERLAEDLRLAYVAMTRARHRCYVVWGEVGRSSAVSALGYLLRGEGWGRPAQGEGSPEDHVRQALEQIKDAAAGWQLELRSLVDGHPGLMELQVATDQASPSWGGCAAPERELEPPPELDLRQRLEPWRMASFSSLSRGREAEVPDHLDPPAVARAVPPAEEAGNVSGMFAFARGTRAGTCLHEILEHFDFTAAADPETRRLVDGTLSRHGLDGPQRHDPEAVPGWTPAAAVLDMLRRLTAAALPAVPMLAATPGVDLTLSSVERHRRLTEWRFYLPLADLVPRRLGKIFREHGRRDVDGGYAGRLEALTARAVHGFLTGFVDLIFTHGERWYIVDWKSNDLGATLDDYGRETMWDAMRHHHYVLQYHLYTVALQRFLRYRLPDYDYDRHFGGAVYVFLRGVDAAGAAGETGSGAGWFVDRPPRALIDELERCIAG
ncbi:MAG: exodeoxyribonuclease V subunit beta [Thermoanaerobaculia bacterium]